MSLQTRVPLPNVHRQTRTATTSVSVNVAPDACAHVMRVQPNSQLRPRPVDGPCARVRVMRVQSKTSSLPKVEHSMRTHVRARRAMRVQSKFWAIE
jgi:hypothetical protein